MFLWVFFQLDDLCEAPSDALIRQTLQNLPIGLIETYERILEKIWRHKIKRCMVQRIFMWIRSARRPLTVEEVREAAGFKPGQKSWDPDVLPDVDLMIEACKGLVVWDREDGMVRFAHHTVQQFLLSDPETTHESGLKTSNHEAENYVGEVCLTYLLFSDFETQIQARPGHIQPQQPLDVPQPLRLLGLNSTSSSARPSDYAKQLKSACRVKVSTPPTEIVEKYTLLQYIIGNWVLHTKGFEPSSTSSRKLQNLAMYKTLAFEFRPWGRNQHYGPYGCGSCKPGGNASSEAERLPFMSLLHYAAEVGNLSLMDPLIKDYCAHEMEQSTTRKMYWDVRAKQMLLSKPLLEKGHPPREKNDWTICIAIRNGYVAIFEYLFKRQGMDPSPAAFAVKAGAMLNAATHCGDTMIFQAVLSHVQVSGRREIYKRDYAHITIAFAAARGDRDMIELLQQKLGYRLVDHQFDGKIDRKIDRTGETAISAAAANGHSYLVSFLVAMGAQLVMKDVTPLHRAAENGHTNVAHTIFTLSERGSRYIAHLPNVLDPPQLMGVLDSEGETPIQRAARNGHADVVQLMFEYIPTLKEKWLLATTTKTAGSQELIKEGTALYLAAANGHIAVVELFYAHMDDRGTQGHGAIAFLAAVKGNHVELVQWLLENGDGTENLSDALRVAVGKGYPHLVQLFLSHYPMLVTLDLLVLAAKNGDEEILEQLVSTHGRGGMYVYPDTTKKLLFKASKKAEADQLEEAAQMLEYYWRKEI
ncbi:MAG: hypothetical protein Q9198_002182 [Flavoplaca austrocitrina]